MNQSQPEPIYRCCNDRYPPMTCGLPLGHPGRHACLCCDRTWENLAETRPCPSTALAVLAVVQEGGALLRCGLLAEHDGAHRFAMQWTDEEAT